MHVLDQHVEEENDVEFMAMEEVDEEQYLEIPIVRHLLDEVDKLNKDVQEPLESPYDTKSEIKVVKSFFSCHISKLKDHTMHDSKETVDIHEGSNSDLQSMPDDDLKSILGFHTADSDDTHKNEVFKSDHIFQDDNAFAERLSLPEFNAFNKLESQIFVLLQKELSKSLYKNIKKSIRLKEKNNPAEEKDAQHPDQTKREQISGANIADIVQEEQPSTQVVLNEKAMELKRISDLKAHKDKYEQELRKMFNQATLKAQAKKWTENESKKAKILEEYNHQISFRADPLLITKISYTNNSNKEVTMKIIRGDNPLNLIVHLKFRLKSLGFSEWLEAEKLGLPPPSALATFGMTPEEKDTCKALESNIRRIRVTDIVKEVEDYLNTYSSAGMDISCVVDENLPQLLDSRGGSHVTNIPAFDKEDLTSWKVRFLVFLDGLEPYLLKTLEDGPFVPMSTHEGPSDTKDTKIAEFNAFKSLEEVNVTFVNSLPRKWLSMNQTHRANNYIKNDSLATLYGKYNYKKNLIDQIYESETQRFTIQASSSKALISNHQFQDSDSDVEEDQRTSNEFMADLNVEYHERALLANQKRFYKRSGQDDPRRAIHSLKVGLSLTLVSLLYLLEPLFKGVGENVIWAVMTVVVVLEFTAGATLCKGLNRGLGTLLAGSLAFLFEFIARESGKVFYAIFIGASVFFIGAMSTYLRFFPNVKKNYDYGVVIFLLTFNLITISSYRVDDVLKIARQRLYTMAIGSGVCILMSLFVFPIWSGEDLHTFSVSKIEGLAKSIEACVEEYFSEKELDVEKDKLLEDPIYKNYKAVLDSKSTDETLALHASWEPRHSWHCNPFPWQQYVKLGAVLRQFGYTVVALHGSLQTEIQTPKSVRLLFKDPCTCLATEVSKALMELADSIRDRRQCSPEVLSDHLHQALQDLDTALKSQPRLFLGTHRPNSTANMLALASETTRSKPEKHLSSVKTEFSALSKWKSRRVSKQSVEAEGRFLKPTLSKIAITSLDFSEALPFAAFAALLVEAVAKLDLVIEEVEELGRVACFKEFEVGDDVKINVDDGSKIEINLPSNAAD
uniref:Aluminum-activated malate transporter 12-like n=1 Tax=Tanacetum cinerariifolium TaxID=118510 RepID=A0A6L2JCL2_TANCI|nr:aluminum-activated malate transporter 12-like [Tanacetum cinerariifolium]